jgi:hypothetical protein
VPVVGYLESCAKLIPLTSEDLRKTGGTGYLGLIFKYIRLSDPSAISVMNPRGRPFGLWACFRTRVCAQISQYIQGDSSFTTSKWDKATYVKDESVLKQLWRVFCLVEMKDKLLDGPMTCCVRFGKLEDPLKLDGVCCPAFHVGSANVG